MKTNLFLSAGAWALLTATAAAAADAGPTDVDAIVVTATRTPERADRLGGQITVLDRAEIEAAQTVVISDLLARTPGVTVSRNGGVGGVTTLRLRGAESDHTVVLIDGVKLNDPSLVGGGFDFAHLVAGDMDRIEVLRGAQSVLWGSQAIGGVINVISAESTRPLEGRLAAEGGSLDTAFVEGAAGGKWERLSWRASAGYYTSAGISRFDEALGGRERDGYRNVTATAKARLAVTNDVSLDLRGFYTRGRAEFDGFTPAFTFGDTREYGVTEQWVGYAGLNLDLFDGRLANRLAYAMTETDRDNDDPDQLGGSKTFESVGRNRRWEYQGTFEIDPRWTAVFGAERDRSSMRSASLFSSDRRKAKIDGGYFSLRGELAPGLTVGGGLRVDDHGDFGRHTVGQAQAAWSLNEGATVLRASYGQGFKAPSLYQLGSEFGNAALEPEEADTWDAGVQQSLADGRLVLSAAYFHRKTTNQIDFVSCFSSPGPLCFAGPFGFRFGYYDNIARTKAQGIELQALARPYEALTLSANYTWTDAENDAAASPNRGNRLPRRPEHQAYAEASWRWDGGLTTAIAVRHVGASFDNASNTVRLKSYTLVDLRASYPLSETVEVYGRVENLLDEHYQTTAGFGEIGRAAYGGLRVRF